MSKLTQWLVYRELQWFTWINQRIRHPFLDFLLTKLTHLGGASAALGISVLVISLNSGNLRIIGIQSFLAILISHIPVAWMKKKYRRLRPYQVFSQTNLSLQPLKDHSFPSGHTTAIFALVTPYMLFHLALAFVLLPLACVVGFSRIYIGLHYPSDCIVGMIIGTFTACCIVGFWI
jgi:undecaprenyl-diphosphatase